ncbi:MAG TPA: extracellular solute-binding protein [Trichocoleus sp.]
MKRRTVLTGALLLPISVALGACAGSPSSVKTQIYLLDRSIPLRLIKAFQRQKQASDKVAFETAATLFDLFQKLQSWQKSPTSAGSALRLPLPQRSQASVRRPDLITLSDAWLQPAIQGNLIQPFSEQELASWQQLGAPWQTLVKRDRTGLPSASGEIWGIPYRWGYLQVIYNRRHFEQLGWQPQRWADLWKPELKHKLALPDHSRVVLGLVLKTLGKSANTLDLKTVPALSEKLASLHQQVRFYSADHYLEPLILEDISVAVGWSTDILPLVQEYRQFAALSPTEGTLISADLWVRPAVSAAEPSEATSLSESARNWVDYSLNPQTALELTLYSQACSPLFWNVATSALPEALRDKPLLTLTPEAQTQSEWLSPLPKPVEQDYQQRWEAVRVRPT